MPDRWRNLIELGFSVFPVKASSKQPALKWQPYQHERASGDLVQEWARRKSNIGIVTGAVSGVFVLDLDDPAAIAEAIRRGMPETVTVRTPRGQHHYFRHPGFKVSTRASLFRGADIRGDGGYVVAPGSQNEAGFPYVWENAPTHFAIAEAPEWLLDLVRPRTKAATSTILDRPNCVPSESYSSAELNRELELLRRANEGHRNEQLNRSSFKLGQLAAVGALDEQSTLTELRTAAEEVGLHPTEIGATTASGWSAGLANPRQIYEGSGVQISDFFAYMPAHSYIFAPNGEMWPAASVNSRLKVVSGMAASEGRGSRPPPANVWLDQNRAVEQMTWAPGEAQVINDRLVSDGGWIAQPGCNVFNLYRPPALLNGDSKRAQPWLEHVERVYPGEANHIIQWLAHRVQRPQEKVNHALVLGGAQGIGKDTILEPIKAAIGPWNFAEVSPKHMLGRFNGFIKSVILRVSEARDLGDVDRFAFYDHMKSYTASPPDVLRIDEKHVKEYTVFNACGVIITTNYKMDGIYLPPDDRRHFVAWSERTREDFNGDYWTKLYNWYTAGGLAHVSAYLADLPLIEFDAKAPPPKTAAFWEIASSNLAPEDAEMSDALDVLGWPNAITIRQVAAAASPDFYIWLRDRRNSRKIPYRLEECGYIMARNKHAKDGLFKLGAKRQAVYTKKSLLPVEVSASVEARILAGDISEVSDLSLCPLSSNPLCN